MGTPAYFGTPSIPIAKALTNTEGTNLQTLLAVASDANGAVVGELRATNSHSSAVTLQFAVSTGGTDYIVAESQVPAGAGTDGSTSYAGLMEDLNASDGYHIPPGVTFKVKAKAAVATGAVHITGYAAPLV